MYTMRELAFYSQTTKDQKKKQQNKNLFTSDPPSLQTQKADLSVSSKTV